MTRQGLTVLGLLCVSVLAFYVVKFVTATGASVESGSGTPQATGPGAPHEPQISGTGEPGTLGRDEDEKGAAHEGCERILELARQPLGPTVLRELAGELRESGACADAVPSDLQIALAEHVCEHDAEFPLPPAWAFLALDRQLRTSDPVGASAACLAGRAASGGLPAAAELGVALAAFEDLSGLVAMEFHRRPLSAEFLALMESLLAERGPGEHEWWKAFFSGLSSDGLGVRSYLYHAMGKKWGAPRLISFLEEAVNWETGVERNGTLVNPRPLVIAGWALRRFQVDPPAPERLIPESPRMRVVMASGVPIEKLYPAAEVPWFGTPQAQARLQSMWDSASSDQTLHGLWRATYVGNEWELAGPQVALSALRSAFEGEGAIEQMTREDQIRFHVALQNWTNYSDGRLRAYATRIWGLLKSAVGRATKGVLVELVRGVSPHLSDEKYRASFAILIQDRLDDLPRNLRDRIIR